MALEVRIITGPPSARVSKEAAAKKLTEAPEFPKGAAFELEEIEGRWIAAIATESIEKVAEFPPGAADEAPAPEGPPAPEAPAEDGPPSDEPEGEDKPPKEDGKKEKGGEKGELEHVLHLLTTLCTALGINPEGADANPVPGLDEGPPAPPGADPLAPPTGPPAPGHDEKTHTVHERALKPGEAPPGSTPVGAPAFASVSDDHPWKGILGQKRTFKVDEPIGDMRLADVKAELDGLAHGTGYRVAQLIEDRDESGQRIARALITR